MSTSAASDRLPARLRLERLPQVFIGLAAIAAIATMVVDSQAASIILNTIVLLGLPMAGVLFMRRSRSLEKAEYRAWRLVGLGLLITATGIAMMTLQWLFTANARAFGPFDSIYLIGYGVGITGFAILPHTHGSRLARLRLFLDGIIGAVAVGTLIWTLFLGDIAHSLAEAPVLDRLIGSTYVLLDIGLIVILMIVVVRRSSLRFDKRLVLFSLAGISQAIADAFFLTAGAGKNFAEAEPLYAMNIAAVTLFVATAANVNKAPAAREYALRTRTSVWVLILPYSSAFILVALFVLRFPHIDTSGTDRGLLYATVIIAFLVISRQAVAIRENRRHVEEQRAILATSISHELRTPLTAIVGFLELLDADGFDTETERAEVTSIASNQAAYLARIVSDLIMLSSDSGEMELDVGPVRLDEVAWSAIHSAPIDSTGVRVDLVKDADAFVDALRIEQALSNLLTNAARYGGERILLRGTVDGGDLTLEVHDDGPGVPRKYELIIWERFERGPYHLNAAAPGSGIGLSVTSAIAKAHGGSTGYRRSERLGGACFWMRLPGRAHIDSSHGKDADIIALDGKAQSA